eukprot:760554-Hanusia_phi.AAC.1
MGGGRSHAPRVKYPFCAVELVGWMRKTKIKMGLVGWYERVGWRKCFGGFSETQGMKEWILSTQGAVADGYIIVADTARTLHGPEPETHRTDGQPRT